MKLLALDSAASACGVAVVIGDELIVRTRPMARGHAEALMPLIAETMAEAGLTFAAIDALAVSVGPGAFTGLRVGLAAARGLALATNRPCFGETTLSALAAAAAEIAPRVTLLAVLETKRGDVYAQAFAAAGVALGPATVVPVAALPTLLAAAAEVCVVGDAADAAIAELRRSGITARAAGVGVDAIVRGVALRARARWRAGEQPGAPPAPVYLRAPDTGPPASRARR